jgi:uncharacterized protein (DUF2235 family)
MAKNICIFSDGTGQGGTANGSDNTNVFRLYYACCNVPGSEQKCFYDPGLGARESGVKGAMRWLYDTLSQATGLGITKNIMDCYEAVLEHYEPGDRIFLFGFSRGAYTVRSLGGVLKLCGVPVRDQDGRSPRTSEEARKALSAEAVKKVYQTYGDDEMKQLRLSRAADFRAKYKSHEVSPYFIGVWDTVRALGLPGTSKLIGWRHEFHDASLDPKVSFARQALSVDERRKVFEPVVWEVTQEDLDTNRVKQVWFAGVHFDVGGGYADDRGLGDLSLNWMIKEATSIPDHHLEIDMAKIAPALNPTHLGLQHDETAKRISLWKIGTREAFHSDPFVAWATIDDPSVENRFKAGKVPCVRGLADYRPSALCKRKPFDRYFVLGPAE